MLLLQPGHLQSIEKHAEETYPHECCGLMLGHVDASEAKEPLLKTLVELWPVKNAWDDEAQSAMVEAERNRLSDAQLDTPISGGQEQPLTTRRRYWIDPKDMLAAQKYARNNGLNIIGIYHSHPDHPAVPSECDRACAWPEYSYIIVSVPAGKASDVFSWVLDDQHQFQLEEIHGEKGSQSTNSPIDL
ncbi:MAG: M67 family metallopeptidase [Cyanobacteria bacterium P01_F01_bin.150]